eukprot:4441734-Pleurochrysis_carterae.AAC.1
MLDDIISPAASAELSAARARSKFAVQSAFRNFCDTLLGRSANACHSARKALCRRAVPAPAPAPATAAAPAAALAGAPPAVASA